MCGIAGIVGDNISKYRNIIPNMLATIKHRGPDDNGEKYFPKCAMGHVRLSIVDLFNGKQPMMDCYGKNCVVFNGEIYGYKEIKQTLDYPFTSNCDTEAILALYHRYHTSMMTHLPGMFAFAIWDEENQILFCARDRFGEKPFFYAIGDNGEFIFASEIKAILSTNLVTPALDYGQLNHFLSYSYVYPNRTIYKNIYTLPPAYQLLFQNGDIKLRRYWEFPDVETRISEGEAIEKFRFLFTQAVKRQLVADVPVGAFLSGGLDSGTVVSVASQMAPQITTVSFGFKGGVNELSLARSMAEKYNTKHIELTDIDFDIADLMYTAQRFYDEPMADPASIPAYLIAKSAREFVKVVLTGDAGDELLGGYDFKYRTISYMRSLEGKNLFWREFFLSVYYKMFRTVRRTFQKMGWYSKDPSVRLSEPRYHDIFIRQRALEWAKYHPHDIVDFMRNNNRFLPQKVIDSVADYPKDEKAYLIDYGFLSDKSALDNALRLDIQEYLPGNGMRKTDRTTMAVGLESRTPFLDVDLATFCISLPFRLKVRGTKDKYVLRKAYSESWTKPVKKAIKNGFASPIDVWMKRKSFLELEDEYLGNRGNKIFQIMDFSKIQTLRKQRTQLFFIWELLHLSMWFELHPCRL